MFKKLNSKIRKAICLILCSTLLLGPTTINAYAVVAHVVTLISQQITLAAVSLFLDNKRFNQDVSKDQTISICDGAITLTRSDIEKYLGIPYPFKPTQSSVILKQNAGHPMQAGRTLQFAATGFEFGAQPTAQMPDRSMHLPEGVSFKMSIVHEDRNAQIRQREQIQAYINQQHAFLKNQPVIQNLLRHFDCSINQLAVALNTKNNPEQQLHALKNFQRLLEMPRDGNQIKEEFAEMFRQIAYACTEKNGQLDLEKNGHKAAEIVANTLRKLSNNPELQFIVRGQINPVSGLPCKSNFEFQESMPDGYKPSYTNMLKFFANKSSAHFKRIYQEELSNPGSTGYYKHTDRSSYRDMLCNEANINFETAIKLLREEKHEQANSIIAKFQPGTPYRRYLDNQKNIVFNEYGIKRLAENDPAWQNLTERERQHIKQNADMYNKAFQAAYDAVVEKAKEFNLVEELDKSAVIKNSLYMLISGKTPDEQLQILAKMAAVNDEVFRAYFYPSGILKTNLHNLLCQDFKIEPAQTIQISERLLLVTNRLLSLDFDQADKNILRQGLNACKHASQESAESKALAFTISAENAYIALNTKDARYVQLFETQDVVSEIQKLKETETEVSKELMADPTNTLMQMTQAIQKDTHCSNGLLKSHVKKYDIHDFKPNPAHTIAQHYKLTDTLNKAYSLRNAPVNQIQVSRTIGITRYANTKSGKDFIDLHKITSSIIKALYGNYYYDFLLDYIEELTVQKLNDPALKEQNYKLIQTLCMHIDAVDQILMSARGENGYPNSDASEDQPAYSCGTNSTADSENPMPTCPIDPAATQVPEDRGCPSEPRMPTMHGHAPTNGTKSDKEFAPEDVPSCNNSKGYPACTDETAESISEPSSEGDITIPQSTENDPDESDITIRPATVTDLDLDVDVDDDEERIVDVNDINHHPVIAEKIAYWQGLADLFNQSEAAKILAEKLGVESIQIDENVFYHIVHGHSRKGVIT